MYSSSSCVYTLLTQEVVFSSVIRSVKIIWQLESLDEVVGEVTYDTTLGNPRLLTTS